MELDETAIHAAIYAYSETHDSPSATVRAVVGAYLASLEGRGLAPSIQPETSAQKLGADDAAIRRELQAVEGRIARIEQQDFGEAVDNYYAARERPGKET